MHCSKFCLKSDIACNYLFCVYVYVCAVLYTVCMHVGNIKANTFSHPFMHSNCVEVSKPAVIAKSFMFETFLYLLPNSPIFLMQWFRVRSKSSINIHMCNVTTQNTHWTLTHSLTHVNAVLVAIWCSQCICHEEKRARASAYHINTFTQPDTHHQHQNVHECYAIMAQGNYTTNRIAIRLYLFFCIFSSLSLLLHFISH